MTPALLNLGLATNNHALFVVHHTQARSLKGKHRDDSVESSPFLIAGEHVLEYPETEGLLGFVQDTLQRSPQLAFNTAKAEREKSTQRCRA